MSKNSATIANIMGTNGQNEQASVNIKQKIEQVWEKVKEYTQQSYDYVAGLFTVVGAMEAFKSIPNWVIYFVGFMGLWCFSAAKTMKLKNTSQIALIGAALYGIYFLVIGLTLGWGLVLSATIAVIGAVYLFVLVMITMFLAILGVDLVMLGKDHIDTLKTIVAAKAFF